MTGRESLFDVIREAFGTRRDEHHRLCTTRADEGCDCYARRFVAAHQAVDELEREFNRLEALQGLSPDLAALLRDSALSVPRDREIRLADGRTLHEHLAEWRNAPSGTMSA